MADLIVQFPTINNIRFTEYPYIPVPNQTIVQFDQAPFIDTVKPWQTMPVISQYAIPATFLDQWTVMVNINTSYNDTAVINLLDSTGALLYANVGLSELQIVAGNTYTNPITGDVTQLATWLFNISIGGLLDPVADNGSIFYLEFVRNYENGDSVAFTQTWRSEPILIQQDHANTLLITAAYNTNKNDVIINNWSTVNPVFHSRVYADIRQFNPTGVQYAYLQQEYEQLTQNTHQSRIFDFVLGDNGTSPTYGVPDWMLERVTAALLADNVLIDNKFFTRVSEGGSWGNLWKKEDSDNVPLITATTKIREVYNTQATTTVNMFLDILGDEYVPSAFAATPTVMKNLFTLNTVTVPYQIYYGESDFDAMVNYLNTVIVPANNMSGMFIKTVVSASWGIVYINGYGENWIIYQPCNKLANSFTFWVHRAAGTMYNVGVTGTSSVMIADFGTNSVFPYDKKMYVGSASVGDSTVAATGNYKWRIFHNELAEQFVANYSGDNGIIGNAAIYAMAGLFPSSLTSIVIYSMAASVGGGWNGAACNINQLLANCASNLTSIGIAYNNIGSFVPSLLDNYNFSSLIGIDFSTNLVDSATVDNEINLLYSGSTYVTTGAFWYSLGQTPPAPPTPASYTAITALIAANWTFTVD